MEVVNILLLSSILGLVFICLAGIIYVIMALEVNRKGKPVKFLIVSFNVVKRIKIFKTVLKRYKEIKYKERKKSVLITLFWLCVILCLVSLFVYFMVLL